jgi:hypothetical protein
MITSKDLESRRHRTLEPSVIVPGGEWRKDESRSCDSLGIIHGVESSFRSVNTSGASLSRMSMSWAMALFVAISDSFVLSHAQLARLCRQAPVSRNTSET